MMSRPWCYIAEVTEVIDGDTLRLDRDCGMDIWHRNVVVRLQGIDTPEINAKDPLEKAQGLRAKRRVEELVMNQKVTIETFKDRKEKYGRYLVKVWVDTPKGPESLGALLVAEGLAKVAFEKF